MPIETKRLKLPLPLGNESVSRVGINAIFEKIDEGVATSEEVEVLRELVNEMDIPDASLTQKGKVQLSSKTDGTSESVAATEKAVGMAFQAGVERKAEVVAALNSIGVSASTSESWAQLINKMDGVIKATGNATAAQVLAGATFSNSSTNGIAGTMPNRGAGGDITPGTSSLTRQYGYYSSNIVVLGDTDLVAHNIKKGVDIFGVVGNYTGGVSPGTMLIASGNLTVERNQTSPVKVAEVGINITSGMYRIGYDLTPSIGGNSVFAQIYVNGVPKGILRSTTTYMSYQEDITVEAGVKIQLYIWSGSSGIYARNGAFAISIFNPASVVSYT
ncbi:phage tail protein [Paenibacillus sp. FSL H8-0317]|uniref:tail fiber protein n=1 Tax=Paenibacillus sp. FSL H8-0317 TaxID=2921385 RepID=UPI003254B81D